MVGATRDRTDDLIVANIVKLDCKSRACKTLEMVELVGIEPTTSSLRTM